MKETALQKQRRLEKKRQAYQLKQAKETEEDVEARKAKHIKCADNESDEHREIRRTKNKECKRKARAAETPEQASVRREKDKERHSQVRAAETPEQTWSRRQKDNDRHTKARVAETADQRSGRQEKDKGRHAQARAAKTPQQHSESYKVFIMTDAQSHMVLLHSVAPEFRLMSVLQGQYTERQMLDLLIYAGDDVIMAHRCLVAFYMKKARIKQGRTTCMYTLHLPMTSKDVVKSLLGLVYFGHLECNFYQVAQLQLAAKQLGFSEAEEACRRYLEAVTEASDETSSMHSVPVIKQEPEDTDDYAIEVNLAGHDEIDNHCNPIERVSESLQNISASQNDSKDIPFPKELKVKTEFLNEVCDENNEVIKDAHLERKNMLKVNFQRFDQDQSVDYMDKYETESGSKGTIWHSQRKRKPTVYVDNFNDVEEEEVDTYSSEEETGNHSDKEEDESSNKINYPAVKYSTMKRLKSKTQNLKCSTSTEMKLKSKIVEERSNITSTYLRSTNSVPLSPTDFVEESPRFMNITTRSPQVVNYDERILCVGTNRSVGIGGSDSDDNSVSEEEEKDRIYVPKLKIIPGNTMPKNCRSKYALPRVVEIPVGRKRKITSHNAQSIEKFREIVVNSDLQTERKSLDSISGTVTEIRVYPTKPVVCPKIRQLMYDKQLSQPGQATQPSILEESLQDGKEKVFYVETGSAYKHSVTSMVKIPDSNEFIVFPTKPVVRHCVSTQETDHAKLTRCRRTQSIQIHPNQGQVCCGETDIS